MTPILLDTILLAAAVAAACAVPGTFLVLRRVVMVGDAISHSLLFGIVVAFYVVPDLYSPWLMVGAAAGGVLTAALVEALQRTRLVKEDAAIGLVFPALFALGTLLATLDARDVHLDVDAVLLGQIELLQVRERVTLGGVYIARLPTVIMAGLFLLNAGLATLVYKELKLSTFDPALAATFGFLPAVLHYGLMTVVSLTTVAAFDAVGPVMVVAFLVVPPMTAYLLTDRLSRLLVVSVLIGAASAAAGVVLAFRLNTNTAGTVATVLGAVFGVVFLAAPGRGLLAQVLRRWHQRREFHVTMLAIHLLQHEGTPAEPDEARADGLHRHLHWTPAEVAAVVGRAVSGGVVTRAGELLKLTEAGRARARAVLGEPTA
jgi:manganese/zinc/iron transport system permease protein